MNSSKGSIHGIGVMALEMSGRGRGTRPPICARLGGQSELVETGFNVKPLVLSFQGMMLPLHVVLWVVQFVDLLIEGVGKSSCK